MDDRKLTRGGRCSTYIDRIESELETYPKGRLKGSKRVRLDWRSKGPEHVEPLKVLVRPKSEGSEKMIDRKLERGRWYIVSVLSNSSTAR